MKGLLYKDWCTLTSRYRKNFTLLFVLYVGMAMFFDMPFMLYALVFVLGLYVQSAVAPFPHCRQQIHSGRLCNFVRLCHQYAGLCLFRRDHQGNHGI